MPLPGDLEVLEHAARLLREGGLVVVPTETVYGLAADALNSNAVRRIFSVKKRPQNNPLICHVASIEQAKSLARLWPPFADRLAEEFWPGPLTFVLPKVDAIPSVTTGGLDTLALRMPGNDVFLRLIELAGTPIAAPSANSYMSVSPTSVDQLSQSIFEQVDFVLDDGPCTVGIESTVIDLSSDAPAILRPGMIGESSIERALGVRLSDADRSVIRSPGTHHRHYAPRATVSIVERAGTRAGLLFNHSGGKLQISMPGDPSSYARLLYRALHEMDAFGLHEFVIEAPPRTKEWQAIWDRIQRAAAED